MSTKCPKCHTENLPDSKYCSSCGLILDSIDKIPVSRTETIETPVEELTTGSTFAERYQIIEELGKGGMGRVYKVLDRETKEKIALKLINPEISSDKKTIERFRNELTTARKIGHRNVCRMFDLNREKENYFITMEYVDGQDLKGLIRQSHQLTRGRAISIAMEICEGLAEAHRLGIIHRDLKPNNIMIDSRGSIRIMDFGIARSLKAKAITGSGIMIGTPEYMSPEQAEAKEVDQRSDIYSLGVILYEMTTGRLPFEGDSPLAVAMKHKGENAKNPQELNPQIPDDLSSLILKCLEKDKENRFQSAEEVRAELENIEQGLPTTDRVAPKKKSLTSREITVQFSMRKIFIPVFAVIAVAFTALMIWSPWSKKHPVLIPSDKPTLAVVYFDNNTGDENLERWRSGFASLLIGDLSQSRILNVLSDDRLFTVLQRLNLLDAKRYSSEDLANIAEQAGVQNIISGTMDKAGNMVIIQTRLHNMDTGEPPKPRRIDTQGEPDFPDAVDLLTRMIKEDLNLNAQAIAGDPDKNVVDITTASPEAYSFYSEGRKLHLKGDYEQSVPFMKRAIEIDPDFALAYRSLAAGNLPREERRKYIQKAFDLSDRVTESERLWIHGNYYSFMMDYDKAVEAYSKLIELRPDSGAYVFLANINFLFGNWDKAIELYEKGRTMKVPWIGNYTQLGYLYHAKGLYAKAREVYQDYIENFEDSAYMHRLFADSFAFEGRYDLAIKEANRALSLDPTSYLIDKIYYLQGDFEATERGYRSWLEKDNVSWKMNGRKCLEMLYRTLGQYGKARIEAQAGLGYAEEVDDSNWKKEFHDFLAYHDLEKGNSKSALERAEFIWDSAVEEEYTGFQFVSFFWKIQAHLMQDDIEKALQLAEDEKQLAASTPSSRDIQYYLRDLGLIELKRGNYPAAIDSFTQSYDLLGGQRSWDEYHVWILFNLAQAYELNGEAEAAKKEYENILALTTGRFWWGDLYVKSYYQLGKIHEQQGNTSQAIENYEKFLSLWKNADPGLPEVDDARKRLAGLRE